MGGALDRDKSTSWARARARARAEDTQCVHCCANDSDSDWASSRRPANRSSSYE